VRQPFGQMAVEVGDFCGYTCSGVDNSSDRDRPTCVRSPIAPVNADDFRMQTLLDRAAVNALRLKYANAFVTENTARWIAEIRARVAEPAPRLDASSRRVSDPSKGSADARLSEEARLSIIREVIAERLLRLIDSVALNAATRNRSCHEVPILEPSGNDETRFTEEVAKGLAARLGLEETTTGLPTLPRSPSPLGRLAQDLFQWSAANPKEADQVMQLIVDVPHRTVKVRCPDTTLVRGERTARR
jgi:hypothetical protein